MYPHRRDDETSVGRRDTTEIASTDGPAICQSGQGVHVSCGTGVVCLKALQWPGGKALNPVQIAQTQKLNVGQVLA